MITLGVLAQARCSDLAGLDASSLSVGDAQALRQIGRPQLVDRFDGWRRHQLRVKIRSPGGVRVLRYNLSSR